jgi:hypothetical protein
MAEELSVKAGGLTRCCTSQILKHLVRRPSDVRGCIVKGGALMFLRADGAFRVSTLPILFYMYTPDLPALRERLLANGIDAPPIRYPGHMRSGEITLKDPDGYRVEIGHCGDAEHEAWLKRIGSKA